MNTKSHTRYTVGEWKSDSVKGWTATIYIAGEIGPARTLIRQACFPCGMCVTLEPTEYIYAGGIETGFKVGLIQYPPFQESESVLREKAIALGKKLAEANAQWSFSVIMTGENLYFSRRDTGYVTAPRAQEKR